MRVRPRPDALGASTSASPISRADRVARVARDVAATKQCVAPGSSGTSAHAAARSASGSRPSQSLSTSEPWRRSRMPALRRRRKRRTGASRAPRGGRARRSARPGPAARPGAACRARRRGGRGRPTPVRARAAWWQALRATRPPIECPTSAICSTSTGHAAVSSLEQVGERAAVVRDVAAAVVADVERRAAEVAREPRAVGRPAAEPPRVLGLHQAVDEHDEARRRRREGRARRRPARAHGRARRRAPPSAAASAEPSRSSASPPRPFEHGQRRRAARVCRDSGRPSPASRTAQGLVGAVPRQRRARPARRVGAVGDRVVRDRTGRRVGPQRPKTRRAIASWTPPMPPAPPPSSAAASRASARSSSGGSMSSDTPPRPFVTAVSPAGR